MISLEPRVILPLEYLFVDGPIPDLTNLVKLEQLSLKANARTGSIPTQIENLKELVLVDLGETT